MNIKFFESLHKASDVISAILAVVISFVLVGYIVTCLHATSYNPFVWSIVDMLKYLTFFFGEVLGGCLVLMLVKFGVIKHYW